MAGLGVVAGLFAGAAASQAEAWPQWRGPQGDGTTREASGWNGTEWRLEEAWQANPAGRGNAGPLVAGGRVYLTGWRDDADHLVCLDAATGRELWRQSRPAPEFSPRIKTGRGNLRHIGGPLATPTLDTASGLLYTHGCDGRLRCWDTAEDGTLVWERDVIADYDPPSANEDFGMTGSPLLAGEWVVVEAGSAKGHLIAFDRRTGEERWRSSNTRLRGRSCGPAAFDANGRPAFASFAHEALVAICAKTGETLGEQPWDAQYGHFCATPVTCGPGLVFGTSVGRTPSTLLRLGAEGWETVWTTTARSKVVTPVLDAAGRRLFVCDGGRVQCVDLADGTVRWAADQRFGKDSEGAMILTGDRKLVLWGGNTLALLDAAAEGFAVLATRKDVLRDADHCYPHPAFGDGFLVVRATNGQTACYRKQ